MTTTTTTTTPTTAIAGDSTSIVQQQQQQQRTSNEKCDRDNVSKSATATVDGRNSVSKSEIAVASEIIEETLPKQPLLSTVKDNNNLDRKADGKCP